MKLLKSQSNVEQTLVVDWDEITNLKTILIQHVVGLEDLIVQPNRSAENIMKIANSINRYNEWIKVLNG